MKMRNIIAVIALLSAFLSIAQENISNELNLFKNANKAYADENYDLAITGYEQILKSGKHSAEVYYNLGNSYYKKNEVGPAIYNYEKALMLDPKNEEILNNLRFANQMKIDAIEPLPKSGFNARVNEIASSLTIDEWAYTSIALVLVTILFIILYIYSATPAKKRLFFILSLLGIVFSILTILTAFYAKDSMNSERFAIVYIDEFKTRSEPTQSSEPSFMIHEGTKVTILEEFENWYRISLANGSKAWLPADTVREL